MADKILYLRGMPEDVVRRAKVRAAEDETTVAEVVAHALRSYLAEQPVSPQIDALAGDLDWYAANRTRLLPGHEGRYVAIVDEQVIDEDDEFGPLARRIAERYGRRPVLITRCERTDRVARVPSPRVVRM